MATLFPGWADDLLSEQDGRVLVAPYAGRLAECWVVAWRDWLALPEHDRGRLVPTTRAGIVHDFAVAQARLVFAGDDSIHICEELKFFKLYIGDRAVLRLKRLSPFHLACNIKTRQQRRWYWHYPIIGVLNEATRLTCGYVLDQTRTQISEIIVSLQYGLEDLIWSFRIDEDAKMLPIPAPHTPPVLPAPATIVDAGPAVKPKGPTKPRKVEE